MYISFNNNLLSVFNFGGNGPQKGLALHGYLGESLDFSSFLEKDKHPGMHWYGLDLLGHGASSTSEDVNAYTEERYVEYIDGVLDNIAAQGEPVVLLAYSFGVRIMLKYAIERPWRVHSLIVISGTPGMDNEVDRAARKASDLRVIEKLQSYTILEFMEYWYNISLIKTQRNSPHFEEMYSRRLTNTSKLGLIYSLMALGQGVASSNWEKLQYLQMPILWIVGAEDPQYVQIGQKACSLLQDVRLISIQKSGHAPHLEQEEETLEVVREFLGSIMPVLN